MRPDPRTLVGDADRLQQGDDLIHGGLVLALVERAGDRHDNADARLGVGVAERRVSDKGAAKLQPQEKLDVIERHGHPIKVDGDAGAPRNVVVGSVALGVDERAADESAALFRGFLVGELD